MLASLIKFAVLFAAIGEGVYLLWVLHRKGALRPALTNPILLLWGGFSLASFAVGLWYARRIDLVKAGTLPREALEPAQVGLAVSMIVGMLAVAIAFWRGAGIVHRAIGASSAPAPDA